MEAKIRSKIIEIQYLAMLCAKIDFHCFINYSAHVDQVDIRLHNGKWDPAKEPIRTEIKIDKFRDIDEIEYYIGKCDGVLYQLKSILKKKKVDYSKLYKVERIEIDYVF